MVDSRAKHKKRNKVNKLVEERMKQTGAADEKLVRMEINRELRAKKKERKASSHEEVEKIKAEVQNAMVGKDKKVIDKAINRAIAKYFSQLKKSKSPQHILKQKANELIVDVNSQLWCPSDQGWWDEECQQKFQEVELLAAMWEINLLKAPQNFGKLYPAVCKKYFDFLAKKRFNSTKESEDKNTEEKVKKSKSALQKRFEEKKAQNTDPQKNDKDLLKEVLDEMNKKEKDANLKSVKQIWKPIHKPFFDQECRDAYEKLTEQAVQLGYDLDSKVTDFKKFKMKNKAECSKYFKLLETKRSGFNAKKKSKLEAKKKSSEANTNSNQESVNTDEKVLEESSDNIKNEADVDETIEKVDRELKKERRKQAKLAKKLKAKKLKEDGKEEIAEVKLVNGEKEGAPENDEAGHASELKIDSETSLDKEVLDSSTAKKSNKKKSKKDLEDNIEPDEASVDTNAVKKVKKRKNQDSVTNPAILDSTTKKKKKKVKEESM